MIVLPVELSLTVADLMLILSANAGAAAATCWGSDSVVDSSIGSGDTKKINKKLLIII